MREIKRIVLVLFFFNATFWVFSQDDGYYGGDNSGYGGDSGGYYSDDQGGQAGGDAGGGAQQGSGNSLSSLAGTSRMELNIGLDYGYSVISSFNAKVIAKSNIHQVGVNVGMGFYNSGKQGLLVNLGLYYPIQGLSKKTISVNVANSALLGQSLLFAALRTPGNLMVDLSLAGQQKIGSSSFGLEIGAGPIITFRMFGGVSEQTDFQSSLGLSVGVNANMDFYVNFSDSIGMKFGTGQYVAFQNLLSGNTEISFGVYPRVMVFFKI